MSAADLGTPVKIAILDDWQDVAHGSTDWAALAARAELTFFSDTLGDEDAVAQALAPFDIVLATRERTPFPASLVARLPRLRMFGLTGSRAGSIDLAGMIRRGITVCRTGGGPGAESTAEIALGLMLAAARHLPAADASVRRGDFQRGTPIGFVLAGKTVGIIGLGRIGATMARYCHALDMHVLAWSENLTAERASAAGATRVAKHELLARADVVSLHLVLSPRTRGIVGAAELDRMKRGAILINTSRGPLVDEAALISALREDRIVAALDVYDHEPLAAGHPLVQMRNTVLTPHLGYSTREVYAEFYRDSVDNALAFLDGKPLRVMTLADL